MLWQLFVLIDFELTIFEAFEVFEVFVLQVVVQKNPQWVILKKSVVVLSIVDHVLIEAIAVIIILEY
jgi:hypothetical protein